MVASQVIGIQSMEAYTLYQRLLQSLRREEGDKLEDEELLRAAIAESEGLNASGLQQAPMQTKSPSCSILAAPQGCKKGWRCLTAPYLTSWPATATLSP